MVRRRKKIISKYVYLCIQGIKIFFQIPNGCCRFSPTCSEYAKEAIENMPILSAVSAIFKRTIKCHPFHTGGYDPVQKRKIPTKGTM